VNADLAASALTGLNAAGVTPQTWSNLPGFVYEEHQHPFDKVLFCIAGTITFHLRHRDIDLHPGDRLDLAAGTRHGATVGPTGVTCMEGHRSRPAALGEDPTPTAAPDEGEDD